MLNHRFISLAVFGWLLSSGCTSTKTISGRNISDQYTLEQPAAITVEYKVELAATGFALRYRIHTGSISTIADEHGTQTYQCSFRLRIHENYSDGNGIDSTKLTIRESAMAKPSFLEGLIPFAAPAGRNVVLDVQLNDLASLKSERRYLDVIKRDQFSLQWMQIYDERDQLILNPVLPASGRFRIRLIDPKEQLFVKFYQRDFPVASAPYAVVTPRPFNFEPDDWSEIQATANGYYEVDIRQPGFYQFVDAEDGRTGGALYYFGPHYPRARTVEDLLLPLRYLTTYPEYAELSNSENLKAAVDAHWLKVAGSPERALQLISAYYGRVERANILFPSYLEGWKSDRGMCYIVFGPPNAVYRATASETWVYGEPGRYSTLTLTFTKVVNPFTPNDFRLNRSSTLKSPWYRAVEFWRQGRIISYH